MELQPIHVECPCGEVVPVGVTAELGVREDGRQTVNLTSDMTDVWAHSFTHDAPEKDCE